MRLVIDTWGSLMMGLLGCGRRKGAGAQGLAFFGSDNRGLDSVTVVVGLGAWSVVDEHGSDSITSEVIHLLGYERSMILSHQGVHNIS